jgi:hypothetical protein
MTVPCEAAATADHTRGPAGAKGGTADPAIRIGFDMKSLWFFILL